MRTQPSVAATRVLVYGVTGSGKTTLARRLSELTGLPWHAVDELCWDANWTPVADDQQVQRIRDICAGDAWILDSAYGKWLDIPLSRVQVIVALDYPRWLSLWRLTWRTLRRVVDREPVCNGNTETLRQALSKDSILLWHFRSFARKRSRIRMWAAAPTGPRVIVLRSAAQTRAWLADLARKGQIEPHA